MEVRQIVNPVFSSNTYILSEAGSACVWLVDIGDAEGVRAALGENARVKGLFLTHEHFDHIYGINKLLESFPDCTVFASEHCKNALYSDKLNLSFYHEDPVVFEGQNVAVIGENEKIPLFEGCFLEVFETPGHTPGCLTFKAAGHLFTGDAFIPNEKVVTKLKGGNKPESERSVRKIMDHIEDHTIVCPGHGSMTQLNNEHIDYKATV
jgi:glyoxylase-like metal-dependent hydrolase (beta-lactamase superfamily II)